MFFPDLKIQYHRILNELNSLQGFVLTDRHFLNIYNYTKYVKMLICKSSYLILHNEYCITFDVFKSFENNLHAVKLIEIQYLTKWK